MVIFILDETGQMLVHTLLVIIRNRSVNICIVLFSGFYNYINLGISVIGDYSSRKPNAAAINAVKSLIKCGVSKGYIKSGYSLRGHRYALSIKYIYIYINLLFSFFSVILIVQLVQAIPSMLK